MRNVLKYIVSRTYKPLLVKYLSGTRTYVYKRISLEVPPEVFHPGFFFSTKMLLHYISKQPLAKKSFLELGAGSGLIAIYASRRGADVTASDINPIAIAALKKNRILNKADFIIIHSDLFKAIPEKTFDFIAINPPYYKKQPVADKDYAWYCGEEGEYFQQLFANLGSYINHQSEVVMILCDGCDIEMVKKAAEKNSFQMTCISSKQTLLEKNFIYKIEKAV